MIWRSLVAALFLLGFPSTSLAQIPADWMDFDSVKTDAERGDASAQNVLGWGCKATGRVCMKTAQNH